MGIPLEELVKRYKRISLTALAYFYAAVILVTADYFYHVIPAQVYMYQLLTLPLLAVLLYTAWLSKKAGRRVDSLAPSFTLKCFLASLPGIIALLVVTALAIAGRA